MWLNSNDKNKTRTVRYSVIAETITLIQLERLYSFISVFIIPFCIWFKLEPHITNNYWKITPHQSETSLNSKTVFPVCSRMSPWRPLQDTLRTAALNSILCSCRAGSGRVPRALPQSHPPTPQHIEARACERSNSNVHTKPNAAFPG